MLQHFNGLLSIDVNPAAYARVVGTACCPTTKENKHAPQSGDDQLQDGIDVHGRSPVALDGNLAKRTGDSSGSHRGFRPKLSGITQVTSHYGRNGRPAAKGRRSI